MSDIDLIPADYRRRLERLGQIKVHALAAVVLAVCCGMGYAALAYAQRQLQTEVDRLQKAKAITETQRADLERLHAEHARMSEQSRLQAGLSGGISAQQMFLVVDRALRDEEVWFTRWTFQRSGKPMDKAVEPAPTGYILTLPKDEGQASAKAWRIDSHMSIHGQARDHAVLSGFVGRLIEQPEVETAQLLNATLQQQTGSSSVVFDLLVSIDMAARK
jgi:cell division protein FtsL